MEAGSVIRIAVSFAGIAVMLFSFWFLTVRKMTAGFAVIWEVIGAALIAAGALPGLSAWTAGLSDAGELSAVCIGALGLCFCYFFSLLISQLSLKNHELAIEVSMLLGEDGKAGCEKELLIILPVKNEEKNIGRVLEQLSRPEIQDIADILCINDASKDASGQIIDKYPCMQIVNIYGLGYGSGLKLGYKYAVRKNYRYVIQMDADGQHDCCNIPLIYDRLRKTGKNGETPDIVLASRFMEGSSEFPVSMWKRLAFWLFRSMIRMATGRKIADPTTGLQGLSRKAFQYYSQYHHFDYQYPDANMVIQMLLLQFYVVEMPAVMHMREDGKSMHSGIEPMGYMPRMFLSVLAVIFRIKVLRLI